MSEVRRITANALFLYVANIIAVLSSLLLSIIIARELGDVVLGKYSFVNAFTIFFAIGLDLGLNVVIVRDVSRDKSLASKHLGNILVIKSILAIIVYSLITLVIFLMDYPHDTTIAVLIFGIYIIITAFADVFRVTFRAFERMKYEAVASTTGRLISTSSGLIAIFLGYGLVQIAICFVIGSLFDLLFSFAICIKKFAKPKMEIDFQLWKKISKVALPLSVVLISDVIYVRLDTVMLSIMKDDAVVGWYNAAYNLVIVSQAIPQIFLTAVWPVMFKYSFTSLDLLKYSCEKSLKYLSIVGLPLAVAAIVLAEKLIHLFYGEEFTQSVSALKILAIYVLFVFMMMPVGRVLIALDKNREVMFVSISGAIVNIVCNFALIPIWSYKGAAIATVITGVFVFIIYFILIFKYLYVMPLHKIIYKPVIASMVMALYLHFLSDINILALVISAAALYIIILYIIGGFSQDDINMFKNIRGQRK